MMSRRLSLILGTALLAYPCLPVIAQVPVPQPVIAQPIQTLYATRTETIRAGAGREYSPIGKVAAGSAVQITGPAPGDPRWAQLVTGGFIFAASLSATPVIVHHHPSGYTAYVPPPGIDYPVGTCQPYSKVVNIAGQPPQQINGTACKQPDGTWKIVNYGVPQPITQPPVVVEQAPVVVAPAPYYRQ